MVSIHYSTNKGIPYIVDLVANCSRPTVVSQPAFVTSQ